MQTGGQQIKDPRRKDAGRRRGGVRVLLAAAVKMLIVVVVVFAFCWLPLYAVNIRIFFGSPLDVDDDEFALLTQTVIPVAQWIALSSCAVNPVVYCLFSAKFRDEFRKLLVTGSCCCCHSPAASSTDRRWSAAATTDRLVTALVDYKSTVHRTSPRHLTVALEMRPCH